jgi:nitroreductase
MKEIETTRTPDYPVESIFVHRWSPRAFTLEPVPEDVIHQLFEAARWAPSAYNEQPWRFCYASTPEELAVFRSLLIDANKIWAENAPVLVFVFAKRYFSVSGKPNRHALFDTGAAWMSLALQALKLGLFTHAMAGIHVEKVYETLNIPAGEYEVICAIAIGKIGDPGQLSEELRAREHPNNRKPQTEFIFKGKYIPPGESKF